MKQKYNLPQTTEKPKSFLEQQKQKYNIGNQTYNPAQAEQPIQENQIELNWWDKFGAGYQQARDTFATSFLDLGEGFIDSLAMPLGALAEWAGDTELKENVDNFVKKEWLSSLPQSDFWQDAHNVLGFDFLWSDEAKQVARNKEALPEIGEQLASGIGSAVGFAALNAIPYVGPVVAGMASGGSAAEQALQEGSSSGQALGYGILKGGLESALEFGVGKGLGKLGAGTGKIAGLGKGASTTMGKAVGKSAATKIATKLGQNFVEEGLEEVLSEVADPFLKKLTYKQDEDLKELIGESHDPEHLLETFFVSGLTGAIFEGGQIATSVATSGGLKSWDIRQEASTLQEINNKMEEAILKGDQLELNKLEKQKEITIKKVEKKFDNYVEYLKSQKDVVSDKKYNKLATSTLQYAEQQTKTKEVLTKEVAQKLFTNKKGESVVEIKSAPIENGIQSKSYYDSKTNTVYLNEQNLSSLNNALETIVHETGHAIHTGGLNTNFVNQMTQDFDNFDSLVDEQYKGKIKSFDDLISHYEDVKGFKQNLLSDEKLIQDKMNEKKISKEQAYQELRNDYMLEEIANDIFSKKYFSNLDELRMVVAANKPSFVQRLKDAYRKRFTNSKNKPSNYKEVMKIFKDGIDQNYQNFKEELATPTGKRRESVRYKTGENIEKTIDNVKLEESQKTNKDITYDEFIKNNKVGTTKFENGEEIVFLKEGNEQARAIVLLDINGQKTPFYCSSGQNIKEGVTPGKWYPFFGIYKTTNQGDPTWFNKGTSKQMANYYNCTTWELGAEYLDKKFGDVRGTVNENTITEKDLEMINKDLKPVTATYTSVSKERAEQVSEIWKKFRESRSKLNLPTETKTKEAAEEIKSASELRQQLDSQKEKLSQNKIDEKRYQTYLRLLKPEIKKAFDYLESKNGNLTYNESKEAQEFSQIVKDFKIEGFDFDKFPKVSAYDTLKEALRPQRDKPEIDESKKIVVSKLKSTPKNAYNSFDKLLEKYVDIYSVFDYYSGEYHLEKWELAFLNEALYQNGRYDEQSKQDIIKYLKMENLDPYLEYQRYLNGGVYPETKVEQPTKLELDEEQKSINEIKEYDFTKLNKQTLMDTALEISKKMQEIYNGTTGKGVNPKYGIINLKNAQISKTVTNEERNFAKDLYKTRYELLEYYSKKLDELFKQIKKQKSDLNMTSGEITKFENDFKIKKIDNGYAINSEMYKNLTKPSSEKLAEKISEIGELTTEQVDENKLKAFNNAKKAHKEEIKKLINEYGLLNQEQEQTQMILEKQINDLTIDNYKDKSGEIKLAIQKFEEKIKNNKTIKHQAKLAKSNFSRTRDILLERFPLEKSNVENQLKELNQSIETITHENYEDQKVLSNVKKKLETFENAIKKNYNQAQKIINDFKTSNANLSITADDIKTLKKSNDKVLKDKDVSLQDKITSTIEVLEQMQKKENEINQKISDLRALSNKPENKNYRSYLQDEIYNYEKSLEENYFTKIREVEESLKELEQRKQDIVNEIEVTKKEIEEKTNEIKEELEKSFEKFEEYETESETKLKEEIKENINSIDFEEVKTKEDVEKVQQKIEETTKKIKNYNNNLEKSIKDFEDYQKTKEEKISKIKEPQKQTSKKTKQVIEEVRTIKSNRVKVKKDTQYVEVESAKTIKGKADITKMKKYKKQTCSDLIDVVGDMLSLVGTANDIQVRVQFTKDGKEIAIQEMFEAFNNGELTNEQLKETLVEILSRGLELKLPDYEEKNGKYYYRKRETFSNINSESLVGTPIKDTILKRLNEIVEQTIQNEGSSTILANKILEHTLELQKAVQEHQKILADLIEEHNKEIEKLTKEKNIQNLEDAKNFEKTIEKVNKRIDKLEQEISRVSDKNTNLKEKVNNSKQELKKLKSEALQNARKLDKETKKRIAAETNLEGVFSFVKADGDFVNRLIDALGVKEKITTENIYEKVAKLYNEGDIDGAINEIINFIKDKKVLKEVEVENEDGSKTTTTEERLFTEVYSEETIKQLKEEMKSTILDRINKGQRFAELPLAYKKLADLKQKIKVEKTTNKLLTKIKDKFTSLKKLANNNKKSIFQNNIDKRFKGVVKQLDNYSTADIMSGEFRKTLLEFKKFLTEEKIDGQTFEELTGLQFPQDLLDQLDELKLKDGQVTLEEIELYDKILGALETFIENGTGQRLIEIDGEKKTLQEHVEDAISEQNVLINKLGKETFSKILQTVDPRVVFKIVSGFDENNKFYKLFEELQKGDTAAMAKEMELKQDLEKFFKQNKGFKKSLKNKVTINGIEATVGEFISLYKLIRRRDAYKHIKKAGLEIGEARIKYQGTDEEVKLQIAKLKSAIEEKLSLKVEGSLNKRFFDLTVEFFKAAADAKETIDKQLYGYSNILRKDENGHDIEYFPIRISSLEYNRTLGEKQFVSKMAASIDYSWNKSVVGDGGMVKVENVNDVISQHARQVAQYYGYALPLDLFNQIYSFKVVDKETGQVTNLREKVNTRFGKSKSTNQYLVEDYFKSLFDDIRGVSSYSGEVDNFFNRLFGKFRKKYSTYVLGANLKVAGVQLAAIPAAYKYVSLKSMLKAFKTPLNEKMNYKEGQQLPDLGKYRTYDKSILKSETLSDSISGVAEAFGKLMTFTDNLTIKFAWKAALYETANKNGTFNKEAATKLFEKIVRETQPQYSAIERSALLRSKNELVKLLTQFQSQSNKNFSAFVENVYKARYYKKMGKKLSKADVKQMSKTYVSIVSQSVMVIAITYLFKFIINDLDEDEFSVLGFIENLFNDLFGLIPFMNNIKLDLHREGKYAGGFINIYEMNLGAISKMYDAINNLSDLFDEDKDWANKAYDSMNALGIAFGIPTENLYKYTMGLLKRFIPEKAIYWDEVHKGLVLTNKTKVNEAIEKEQYELAETYYKEYTKRILELDDQTTKIMFNLYKEGYTNAYLKQVPKTLIVDNEEIKVDRKQFMNTYSKLKPQLQKLVRSNSFKSLTKEQQEKAISKLINLYYSLAKKDCIGNEDYTELEIMVLYCKNFNVNIFAYLTNISALESTENETKKSKAQKYINSLPISSGEKYLLYYLSGYKLSERNQVILKSFLSSKGLPKSYIKVLFN